MKLRAQAFLAALVIAGVTGCGSDPAAEPGGGSTTGTTPAPASESGRPVPSAAPACVSGSWRATGVQSGSGFGTVNGRLTGGSGVTMQIGPDGVTEVGFRESQPVDFAAEAAGATVRGQVQYTGSLQGAVRFQPQDRGTGQWSAQADAAGNDLRATVKLTEPVSVTLIDDASVGKLAGTDLGGAGEAVDILPILRGGTYRCDGATLTVRTEQNGPTLAWTFTRTS